MSLLPRVYISSADAVTQAPTRPSIRQKAARAAASGRGALPSTKPSPSPLAGIASTSKLTKKDKRELKHTAFVSKIEKKAPQQKTKTAKRRRPSKKLVTTLDSLADALPDVGDETQTQQQRQDGGLSSQVNIIKHKTLKHKPGAMKRKEKLEKMERDRFVKNLAQMAVGIETGAAPAPAVNDSASNATMTNGAESSTNAEQTQTQQQSSNYTTNRWAALRSFISQTMERQPVFNNR